MQTFDRKDGTGADWRLMLESLYRARFGIADDQLDDDARRSIMRRVHEGAEVRLTGGFADGSGASKTDPARAGFRSLEYWRFQVTGAARATVTVRLFQVTLKRFHNGHYHAFKLENQRGARMVLRRLAAAQSAGRSFTSLAVTMPVAASRMIQAGPVGAVQ